jgi:oligopeptide/dipeptide ABC transporter ATP-binding protein
MAGETVLEVRDLRVRITRHGRTVEPVSHVSLSVAEGECLGLVGESGCGKSLTLKSIIGLLPYRARSEGELLLRRNGSPAPYRPSDARGRDIGMIFQEPMAALNPSKRVGNLIAGAAMLNLGISKQAARRRAIELMTEVGIPAAERRARAWPHQLSGGLRQRVLIAMALVGEPRILLCDEPTTALDVTVQDQILGLLDRLRRERGLAIVFVTHDLAVIRQIAHRIAVMYAGQIVQTGSTESIFDRLTHPYAEALIESIPAMEPEGRLTSIPGAPPDPRAFPAGCRFAPRCPHVRDECRTADYRLVPSGGGQTTACLFPEVLAGGAP